jgi:tetratricopeptide (TPR) repeat protein
LKEVKKIMRDQDLLEKYKRLLPQQQGIQHLIESIALAEKSFTILVCEDQNNPEGSDLTGAEYQAQAALQVLVKQVAARREEPLLLLHFAFKRNGSESATFKGLISQILEPLYYWEGLDDYKAEEEIPSHYKEDFFLPLCFKKKQEPFNLIGGLSQPAELPSDSKKITSINKVFVIDASNSEKRDEEAWMIFFQRMNEVRNTIMKRLSAPLLLIVTSALEMEFALRAPDFWSIRSDVARAEADERAPLEFGNLPRIQIEYTKVFEKSEIERVQEQTKELREQVAATPAGSSAARALVILLTRLGDYEMQSGSLNRAQQAYEESLRIMCELVRRDSQNSEWRRALADSLEKVGNVYEAFGNLKMAFPAYEEGLEIKRSLAKIDPERTEEWRWDLSAGLVRAGDKYIDKGNLEKGIDAYKESLELRESLIEMNPAQDLYHFDIAVSYSRMALAAEAMNDQQGAIDNFHKALSELEPLTRRRPDVAAWKKAREFCNEQGARLKKEKLDMEITGRSII